jgi:hypothetical protein
MPRSKSSSGQFVVYHHDSAVRGSLIRGSEALKEEWLKLLAQRDHWDRPIIIYPGVPDRPTTVSNYSNLRINTTPGGLQFEVRVIITDTFDAAEFSRTLISALFLELAYRGQSRLEPGEKALRLPPWLVHGATAYIRREHHELPDDLFDHLINTDQLLTLREFLAYEPQDPRDISTRIYSVYAYAFLRMLRELPNGSSGLARFAQNLPEHPEITPEVFFQYFPVLETEGSSLEKWWTINLAKLSTIGDWRMLSIARSEQRLGNYLHNVEVPAPEDESLLLYDISEWRKFIESPHAKAALVRLGEKLGHLSVVCDPLYLPVVNGYINFARRLYEGTPRRLLNDDEELDAELRELAEQRPVLREKRAEITDYLNWYEATRVGEISGVFDEYLRISRAPLEHKQLRRDDMTAHLNWLEYQMATRRERPARKPRTQRPQFFEPWREVRSALPMHEAPVAMDLPEDAPREPGLSLFDDGAPALVELPPLEDADAPPRGLAAAEPPAPAQASPVQVTNPSGPQTIPPGRSQPGPDREPSPRPDARSADGATPAERAATKLFDPKPAEPLFPDEHIPMFDADGRMPRLFDLGGAAPPQERAEEEEADPGPRADAAPRLNDGQEPNFSSNN